MNLEYPYFHVNFKIYPQTIGEKGLEYAKTVDEVKKETGTEFMVTPQIPDIRLISENTDLPTTAPYADAVKPGRGMGHILLETLKEAGAEGVVINHAEHRDKLSDIEFKIQRCKELELDSIICVDSIQMGKAIASLDPDAVIFEKPGDISTEKSITKTHPERVKKFVKTINETNSRTKVLVGGGIHEPEDVKLAFELGADATGAASALIRAEDRYKLLKEMAEEIPKK